LRQRHKPTCQKREERDLSWARKQCKMQREACGVCKILPSLRHRFEDTKTRSYVKQWLGMHLGSIRTLRLLITLVHEMEVEKLQKDLHPPSATSKSSRCRDICLIFDATPRLGDLFAVVARYVDERFCICQRLLGLRLQASSYTADDIKRVVGEILQGADVDNNAVLALCHDRASPNICAVDDMCQVLIVCPITIAAQATRH